MSTNGLRSSDGRLVRTARSHILADFADTRARRKPLKPLRAGTSGDSGVLVVTRVRSTTTKCTRGRGCQGHPAFPTPSLGGRFINGSGAWRGEVVNACLELRLAVIASAAKQSTSPRKGRMDCFAALAMTIYYYSSSRRTPGATKEPAWAFRHMHQDALPSSYDEISIRLPSGSRQ